MSRSLGKEIKAELSQGDADAAYKAVAAALRLGPTDVLLEIEMLPKGHAPSPGAYLLRDGPAVAFFKLGLVQAFVVARKVIRTHLDKTAHVLETDLNDATAVALLMDPEFLTAANIRKRLLWARLFDPDELRRQIAREQRVVDSLLTSRLHRHTKSPTLWNHRRWLLELAEEHGVTANMVHDLTTIVMVAGDRHPRNYYAWSHARYIVTLPSADGPSLDQRVLPAVKDWCFRHHTDISGWSFLHYLLGLRISSDPTVATAIFEETIRLAISLRWANESVWTFLRTMVASRLVGNAEHAAFLTAAESLGKTARDPDHVRVLEQAVTWCNTYRVET